MNSIRFCRAKSETARPTCEKKVPINSVTFSRTASSLAAVSALPELPAVVARNDFEGSAEHAALIVDLGECQLPAVAVGKSERRQSGVGVYVADADRLGGRRKAGVAQPERGDV